MRAEIHCDIQELRIAAEHGLKTCGLTICRDADWHIVLDAPLGWASLKLDELSPTRTIIVSDNPCPEYKLDLLERSPAGLLSQVSIEKLAGALEQAGLGELPYPLPITTLTPKERFTLRLIAEGHRPETCAKKRNVSEGTLRNTVQTIYSKLGLRSRVQLAHYYYGNWLLLAYHYNWQPRIKPSL